MNLPGLTGWNVEALRVTFIANGPLSSVGKNWWLTAVGVDPEIISSKPSSAEHSESGPYGLGKLEMKVSFNRVDWIYSAVDLQSPSAPILGQTEEVLPPFLSLIENWIKSNDSDFVRIAFSPILLYNVDNEVKANEVIFSYLPGINFDPNLVIDFFNQVNFPTTSKKIDNLRINRISKFMNFSMQAINMNSGGFLPTIHTLHYCRAEFDFNTDAKLQEKIEKDDQVSLVHEFISEYKDIISNGVKP